MMDLIQYAGAASVVWIIYELYIHRDGSALGCDRRTDLDGPPGSIPLLGDLLTMQREQPRIHSFWLELKVAQKDKSRALSLTIPGGVRIIDCSSPAAIEQIQKSNFQNYCKGEKVHEVMESVLGDGIFAVDGEKWLTIRKATSKIFSAANFRGIIATSINEDLTTLKAILKQHAESGADFDLGGLFFQFTLSSFTKMAFSLDIGALSLDTTAPPVPFAVAFDFAQYGIAQRAFNPIWKFTERFTEIGRKMRAATKVLDDFAYDIIDRREAEGLHTIVGDQKGAEKDGKMDLLSLYMQLRDENGKPMAKKALRDSVLNLIIAGRDTTAQALSWLFFRLMKDPALFDWLREEISNFPDVDYDNHKDLIRCSAAFNEALRLHPSVPKNVWEAKADDILPGGIQIRAGDRVRWSDWEMGRDETVWGEDAKVFKPSRWIKDNQLIKEGQFKAHWFNAGPRLCLGQNLATFEAVAVIATIIRSFDFQFAPHYLTTTEMVEVDMTPKYSISLTLPMLEPLRVKVTSRFE